MEEKIMKKIIIFFIFALFFINSIYADENMNPELIESIDPNAVIVVTYDTQVDSDNTTTVEQTNTTQNNIFQENVTTQNNGLAMENNTQLPNNTQSWNNESNNGLVVNSMPNTANPLFVLLIACILIPMGIYRKSK